MTADQDPLPAPAATCANVERAQFLRTGVVPPGVRADVADSWRRSVTLHAFDDVVGQPAGGSAGGQTLEKAMPPPMAGLVSRVSQFSELKPDPANLVLLLADLDGLILSRQVACEQAMVATDIGLFPGRSLHEDAAGTNAVAVAMVTDEFAQVGGAEHLLPCWTIWQSTAGPVRDLKGERVGYLAVFERTSPNRATLEWLRLAIALIELEMQRQP